MQNNYSYQGALEASGRINWRVEDITGGGKRLDFDKPLMPEALAQVFLHRILPAHGQGECRLTGWRALAGKFVLGSTPRSFNERNGNEEIGYDHSR